MKQEKRERLCYYGKCLIIYYLFISNKDPYHSLLRDEGTCHAFTRIRPRAPSLTLIVPFLF